MPEPRRADLVSAWALGVGAGLIALQVTWLAANRVATLMWGVPVGPTVGLATAIVVGIGVSVIMGRRFAAKVPDPHQTTEQRESTETAT
jgi:hypothetical protein